MINKSFKNNYFVKKFLLILLFASLIISCGGIKPRDVEVRTNIAPMANQNEPIAVDVILVTDKELIKEMRAIEHTIKFRVLY